MVFADLNSYGIIDLRLTYLHIELIIYKLTKQNSLDYEIALLYKNVLEQEMLARS